MRVLLHANNATYYMASLEIALNQAIAKLSPEVTFKSGKSSHIIISAALSVSNSANSMVHH